MKSIAVITTYPKIILGVAIFFILATLYGYFVQGTANATGLIFGLLIPVTFYLGLEKKIATFNKGTGILSIYSKYPLKETTTNISINEITSMEVVRGRGSSGGPWFIKISTKDKSYPITSLGSLSKRSLEIEVLRLQPYLLSST
jgi:hypothetical protein